MGEAATSIFSFDCLAANYLKTMKSSNAQTFRMFYIQLLLFILLPILLCVISASAWKLISLKYQMTFDMIKTKSISTMVILLFFVHPNIVKQVFQTFYCLDIDGESRLKQDLEIKCFQGPHSFWSLGVAIPGMIIWGFGIPIFAFILLSIDKEKLDKIEVRQKLGFLFRGYVLRYYYWEIVIMLRKIALILIQSFLVQFGVLLQALVVFVLLILFSVLTMTLSPFQTVVLNRLEIMSLLASMLTVYCGIFYLVQIPVTDIDSGQTTGEGIVLDEDTKLFFFFIILASNFTFLISWTICMYLEVKQMLIKKFGKVYAILCLCGMPQKLEKLQLEIAVREENEVLREKYMDICDRLKELYNDGKLMLNQKNIEKVDLYLQDLNVLKAAGIDPEEERLAYLEKNAKLFKRKYKKGPISDSNITELIQGPQDQDYQKTLYQDRSMVEVDFLEGEEYSSKNGGMTEKCPSDTKSLSMNDEEFKSPLPSTIIATNAICVPSRSHFIHHQQKTSDAHLIKTPNYYDGSNWDDHVQMNKTSSVPVLFGDNYQEGQKTYREGDERYCSNRVAKIMSGMVEKEREQMRQQQADSILIIPVKQEKNLHQVALERERKRSKKELQRLENGYKKLRKSRFRNTLVQIAPLSSSNSSSQAQNRIEVEDFEEEESKEEQMIENSKVTFGTFQFQDIQ